MAFFSKEQIGYIYSRIHCADTNNLNDWLFNSNMSGVVSLYATCIMYTPPQPQKLYSSS